jgi:hypothetical protein
VKRAQLRNIPQVGEASLVVLRGEMTTGLTSLIAMMIAALCACQATGVGGAAPRAANEPHARLPVPVRTGDVHDFDFLAGAWTVENRTRKPGEAWKTFASTTCVTLHMGGVVNTDEFTFPSRGYTAMTVRTFDLARRQWSIYWVESRSGVLLPPVVGGFTGDRGEFYGRDVESGQPVLYRYVWTRVDADHARWAQAFTSDGMSWHVNWEMALTRVAGPGCARA